MDRQRADCISCASSQPNSLSQFADGRRARQYACVGADVDRSIDGGTAANGSSHGNRINPPPHAVALWWNVCGGAGGAGDDRVVDRSQGKERGARMSASFGAKPAVLRCSRCGTFIDWADARAQVVCECKPRIELPPVLVREAADTDRAAALDLFRRDFGRSGIVAFGQLMDLDASPAIVAEMNNE